MARRPPRGDAAPSRRPLWVLTVHGILLATWVSLAPTTGAAEPWPTTRFNVFTGNPFMGSESVGEQVGFDWVEFEDVIGGLDDAVIAEIERALGEAAAWYQRHEFPPPLLVPIVETEEGPAYQVYVCSERLDQQIVDAVWPELGVAATNLTGIEWARCMRRKPDGSYEPLAGAYVPRCGDDPTRTRILYINPDRALDENGRMTELGYQTVAHELMHAIIANTPMGRSNPNCDVDPWITEGIPDAISFDIAEELWSRRYQPGMATPEVIKRYGYRPYVEPLPQAAGVVNVPNGGGTVEATYTTSSFWRYLSDASPEKWRYLLTRRPGAAPGLLDLPLPDGQGWQREVAWLEQGLKGKFNLGLSELYGLFVTNLAFRVAPMASYQGRPAEQNLEHWIDIVFGTCAEATVSAAAPWQTVTLQLDRLASTCLWVNPTGAPGAVQISFQSASNDLSLLRDITVGRAGTMLLARSLPGDGSALQGPYQYYASWRDFPQDGRQRTLYIVSNVAEDPAFTEPRTLELAVVFPGNRNSARSDASLPPARVAPPPLRPSYDRHARSLARQRKATAEWVAAQMDLDKESLNPNVSRSTRLARRPSEPPCEEPFRYTVCGPHLLVSLSVEPGSYIAPGQTTAAGGIAAQTFGGLQAMSRTSLLDTEAVTRRIKARLDQIDGSQVDIAMPLVDYGFTGGFDNASITVRMSGDRQWRTFGPPDAQGRTRLTGQVTLEEYTPFMVRGSFVAPLAEFVQSGDAEPVYVRRDTVSGTFVSVAPWQDDARARILQLDTQEQLADDIGNTLGIAPGTMYSLKQNGAIPGGSGGAAAASAVSGAPGSSGSGGGSVQSRECTCECEARAFADELCALLCEEEFAACPAP